MIYKGQKNRPIEKHREKLKNQPTDNKAFNIAHEK